MKRNYIFLPSGLHACFAVILFCLSLGSTFAQDVHFSQYYNAPMTVNPALTGVFDGVVRVCNSYRSQWSPIGEGFKTIQLSVDAPLGKTKLDNRYFGVGLQLYQDKAGVAEFRRTIAEASLSYTTALEDAGMHWLSIGFQGGLNQLSIDMSKATWDEQWNGDQLDPSIPTSEKIQLPKFSHLNLNAGVNYLYTPDGFNSASAGISLSHIGSPNATFFPVTEENPLRSRISVHGSGEISLDDERIMFFNPRVLMQLQGKQKELVAGGYFRNRLRFKSLYTGFQKQIFFDLGAFYRMNESLIVSSRLEYHSVAVGVSYDLGVGKLSSLSAANSWEIGISYVAPVERGQRVRHKNKMPRFL